MPQVIYLPPAAESPLAQAITGLALGFRAFQEGRERKRRLEQEERRVAAQEFAQRLGIADLTRQAAAATPLAHAPTVQTVEDMAGEAGVPPMSHDVASFAGLQLLPTPTPKRALMLTLPGGRTIPLAPLQYREEVRAQHLADVAAEKEAGTDVMDVPNDASMWGPLAGQRGIRVSTANAYMNALQRKDAAEQNRLAREAVAESQRQARLAVLDARREAQAERKTEEEKQVDAWVDSLARGEGVLPDVPATLRNAVREKAERLRVPVAMRKLGDPAIERLTDAQSLLRRMDDVGSLESGFGQWLLSNVPDALTQLTGLGEKAKVYQPAYFLHTAEVLKATQGSRPSDFDMKSYLANLPKIGDPPDVKAAKVARLRKQLTDNYNSKVGTYRKQGFNVTGFDLLGEPAAPAEETRLGPDGRTWRKVRGGWQVVK